MSKRNRPWIGYLPNVLRDVAEYQALAVAIEPELAMLWQAVKEAMDDQFVLSATERGVKRWEKILKITPKATFTLDERKFTILARLAEQLPFTIRMLHRMLADLCGVDGYKVRLVTNDYLLEVKVALTAKNNFDDVGMMLRRVCPANLEFILLIEYNQHFKLKPFRHGELQPKTHYELRNEVL